MKILLELNRDQANQLVHFLSAVAGATKKEYDSYPLDGWLIRERYAKRAKTTLKRLREKMALAGWRINQ